MSSRTVGKVLGCDASVVTNELRARGIPVRTLKQARAEFMATGYQTRRRNQLPDEEIVARYIAGESSKTLGNAYSVYQRTIRSIVKAAGVEPRSRAQARKLVKWQAAHERGALTAADNLSRSGWGEDALARALSDRGKVPHPQHPVGIRNIDVAIEPVAVEVWLSGSRPDRDAYCLRRIEDLGNSGWWVCYVLVSRRTRKFDVDRVADEVVTLHELAKSDPPTGREHWVIRGTGELAARLSTDGHPLT